MDEIYIAAGSALIGAGLIYLKMQPKYQQVKTLITLTADAIQDDKITEAELKGIATAAKALIT